MASQIKEHIEVQESGKVVTILINATGETLILLNSYVDTRLQLLKDIGCVKWYSNKVDFFVAMPQRDWRTAELYLEIKKKLGA